MLEPISAPTPATRPYNSKIPALLQRLSHLLGYAYTYKRRLQHQLLFFLIYSNINISAYFQQQVVPD